MTNNKIPQEKYIIEYENGDLAGFTYTGHSDRNIYLWRSGSKWKIAEFDNLKDAKDVIEVTNRFQKENKWKVTKFKIKRKDDTK